MNFNNQVMNIIQQLLFNLISEIEN